MKRILLHVCCGVCAFASVERLKEEGYYVETFFYNPNIQPYQEYLKRKESAQKVSDITKVKNIDSKYNLFGWYKLCKSLKDEKEGGRRCGMCYKLRMKETFRVAESNQFDYFTTTLTISPHKVSSYIFEMGKLVGGDCFLDIDFKKKDGFIKSVRAAKEFNLYRQNYCGCAYSRHDITKS